MHMEARIWRRRVAAALALAVLLAVAEAHPRGVTSKYRRKLEASEDMPLDADVFAVPPGRNAPQQVHITLGDQAGTAMTVSWVTMEDVGNSTVMYGCAMDKLDLAAVGTHTRYKYYNYTSGFIHHCTLTNLEHGTKYYYAMGFGDTVRTFCFTTPPKPAPDVPLRLGLIGDLGQTADSNSTLTHYEQHPGDAVLFVGDLSYADKHPFHDNNRWDTWGRFSERIIAYQPWIWTTGNHEIDYAPELGELMPFKPFTHRYPTPYRSSESSEPYWYSVKLASAHIIVLSSYSGFGKYTPQFKWLEAELKRVNRSETPWLFIASHAPWYNSNNFHYMEGEPMRVQFEKMAIDARVDIVFAGHVHAYERSHRFSNIRYNITDGKCTPVADRRAPVYITIGDGGNIEGLADELTWPQPAYSAFRESSFGHAVLDIKNRTHAYYAWYRNHDGNKVAADTMWFTNRYHMPNHDESLSAATASAKAANA
ncbi:purple acid phosphatase 2-like [Phragmites australis]|uniref:purple acid phosphatase 2-like n=1 Tax=Phragmites australis TaxID=29695 RepID=UPI002D79A154|nr:purple acid phosphatase 2-like [Phragmites australis]